MAGIRHWLWKTLSLPHFKVGSGRCFFTTHQSECQINTFHPIIVMLQKRDTPRLSVMMGWMMGYVGHKVSETDTDICHCCLFKFQKPIFPTSVWVTTNRITTEAESLDAYISSSTPCPMFLSIKSGMLWSHEAPPVIAPCSGPINGTGPLPGYQSNMTWHDITWD